MLDLDASIDILKSDSGGCNEDLVRSVFLTDDAATILSISPSSAGVEDSLIWHYDPLGQYLVKSGYRVGYLFLRGCCGMFWVELDGVLSAASNLNPWSMSFGVAKLANSLLQQDVEALCVVW
ncbi:hypothetical protein ACOSQ4_006391 [Xanthoceras sorbifolium]